MDSRATLAVEPGALRAGVGEASERSARWLALVRIAVGLWFLKSVLTKLSWTLVGGIVPVSDASCR